MTGTRASQPLPGAESAGAEIALSVATAVGAEEAGGRIERELRSLEGIEGAAVDLVRHEVLVRQRAGSAATAAAVRARIGAFGWGPAESPASSARERAARRASILAGLATLAAIAVTVAGALTAPGSLSPLLQLLPDLQASIRHSIPLGAWPALWLVIAISTAAVVLCGRDLFARAAGDLRTRVVTRRLLCATAIGALFLAAIAGAAITLVDRPAPPLLFGAAVWSLAAVLAGDALSLARAARRRERESTLESSLRDAIASSPWHRGRREERSLAAARWWAVIALNAGAIAGIAWAAAGAEWSVAVLAGAGVLLAAAPAAFIAGSAVPVRGAIEALARSGIAIRGGETLDRVRAIGTVATNLRGGACDERARIAEVLLLHGTSIDSLLGAAASAVPPDHPLGALIRERAGAHPQERPTAAIATIEETNARGVATAAIAEEVARFEAEGKAVLAVAEGSRLLGAITIAFDDRPAAAETIDWLNRRDLRTVLLTRHAPGTAAALTARLGFGASQGAVARPFDSPLLRKSEAQLRAWVSNDEDDRSAKEADVAITFAGTLDRAPESDAVLMTGSFHSLRLLIEGADRTERSAALRQRWLFAYHGLALPVAGGALMPLTGLLPSPFLAALGSVVAFALASAAARLSK